MAAICKSVMLGIALHPSLPLSPGTLRVGGGRRRIRGGGVGGGGGEEEEEERKENEDRGRRSRM